MRQKQNGSYTRAGTARRCGRGLVLDIAGASFYITPEEFPSLLMEQHAEVVNEKGEQEGSAWLSPVIHPKKEELTALIRDRLFVLTFRDMNRLLCGGRRFAKIKEYDPDRV